MLITFFYKLIIYIIIIVSIVSGINFYLDTRIHADNSKWRELFDERVKPEVIIIGASHAANGINPELLELKDTKVFNFAMAGSSPTTTLKWYIKLFRRYHSKPKSIIYEVNWFMFDVDWLSLKYENLSHCMPRSVFVNELLTGDNNIEMLLLNRFPLFYLTGNDLLKMKKEPAIKVPMHKKLHYNGFIFNDDKPINLNEKRLVNTRISEKQTMAFIKLLDTLKNDGINVVLVQAPEYLEGRSSTAMQKNNAMIRSIANEKGLEFLNFNEELKTVINANNTFYSDWGHLNRDGSRAFSELLSQELIKLKFEPYLF